MAKTFRPTIATKAANGMLGFLLRRGKGPGFMRILTVTGRRTGQAHSTPVVPVVTDEGRWLVSPYGEVGWVRNARAAGQVTLTRGDESETLAVTELPSAEAAPILRRYLAMPAVGKRVQPYFDVSRSSSDEEFAAEAPRHPVFALGPAAAPG